MNSSYEIAINELKLRKLAAEQDFSRAVIERDRIHQELEGLRRVITDTYSEKNRIENSISDLRKMENNEAAALEKLHKEFTETSLLHRERISQMELEAKQIEKSNASAERFVDYSKENAKARKEIALAKGELKEITKKISDIALQREKFDRYVREKEEMLESERERLLKVSITLEKREEKISLTEKRLEAYKSQILSKG